MSKITKKVTKEVDETIGYTCDNCNNKIDTFSEPTAISYTYEVGFGERNEEKHVCSKKCLLELLGRMHNYYGANRANIKLNFDVLNEFNKKDVN